MKKSSTCKQMLIDLHAIIGVCTTGGCVCF